MGDESEQQASTASGETGAGAGTGTGTESGEGSAEAAEGAINAPSGDDVLGMTKCEESEEMVSDVTREADGLIKIQEEMDGGILGHSVCISESRPMVHCK